MAGVWIGRTITQDVRHASTSDNLYSLFIPDNGTNGDAILSRYWADGGSSWVSHRFGKCRVQKMGGTVFDDYRSRSPSITASLRRWFDRSAGTFAIKSAARQLAGSGSE
jgi:hypothetical protein